MKKMWMIALLLCLGACANSDDGEGDEDFGPYPTKAEARKTK